MDAGTRARLTSASLVQPQLKGGLDLFYFLRIHNVANILCQLCGEIHEQVSSCSGEVVKTERPLALDVSLEKARALHRVWRALNDGDCPKCHHAVAATDIIRMNLKGGVWLKCPNSDCGFHVMGEEITEIERMFAPAMDAAVAIFEEWRASGG